MKYLTQSCMNIATGFGFTITKLENNKIRCDVPYAFTYPNTFVPMVWGPEELTEDAFVLRMLRLSEHVAIRYADMTRDKVVAFS